MAIKTKSTQMTLAHSNVFADLGFTPEEAAKQKADHDTFYSSHHQKTKPLAEPHLSVMVDTEFGDMDGSSSVEFDNWIPDIAKGSVCHQSFL